MDYTIKNKCYELMVATHGAEIRSLKKNGRELMWQANPEFWGRTSPVLFPLVGNYYQKKSFYEGKTYEMSQHGFARDCDFELIKGTDKELLFELRENEETLKKYPFAFVLQIGYTLEENGIKISWIVKNPDVAKDMYFSIGGHPAFNCDLGSAKLLFTKEGTAVSGNLRANIIEGDGSGCLSDRTKDYALKDGVLQLSKEMFDEDALIIEDRQADAVALLDAEGKEVLKVAFDAPLFGIWSPAGKGAPFVCIEPWYGRCDRVGFEGDLTKREYGNKLGIGETFEVSYTIS